MSTECQCEREKLFAPENGRWCETFKRQMSLRDWEICSLQCPLDRPCFPDMRDRYQAAWKGEPAPKPQKNPPCRFLGEDTGERKICNT